LGGLVAYWRDIPEEMMVLAFRTIQYQINRAFIFMNVIFTLLQSSETMMGRLFQKRFFAF